MFGIWTLGCMMAAPHIQNRLGSLGPKNILSLPTLWPLFKEVIDGEMMIWRRNVKNGNRCELQQWTDEVIVHSRLYILRVGSTCRIHKMASELIIFGLPKISNLDQKIKSFANESKINHTFNKRCKITHIFRWLLLNA